MKSLKILSSQPEVVIRRLHSTMAKRKRTKLQTTINKILHRPLKIDTTGAIFGSPDPPPPPLPHIHTRARTLLFVLFNL